MDVFQVLISDVGGIFFAAWGMALAAFGIIAFGRDIVPSEQRTTARKERC
jgi:uncharacterized membrane protein YccF (DUF307 family)